MEAVPVNKINEKDSVKIESPAYRIKHLLKKIVNTDLVDVDAILKSDEWPHLWRK